MRLRLSVCLIFISCLFVGLEAKRGGHHRKGENHGLHGHGHKNTWDKKSASRSNKHEIHMKKISWLNVPEVIGCKCRHAGEICIEGPNKQPTCVQKHHLRESARLFKHYHERKEEAEEELNEVDPKPHNLVREAPRDVHINVVSQHKALRNNKGHHKRQRVLGLKPKHGKHNLVLSHTPRKTEGGYIMKTYTSTTCDHSALDEMQRRLTGWFHLLHGKGHHHHHGNRQHHKSHRHLSVKKELRDAGDAGGQCDCLKSVMWEFRQIDTDRSRTLSKSEVKVIDNNDMEPCLHPYLMTCDKNNDGLLSRHEWCCCFPQRESESPCYAKLNEIEMTKNTEVYIPSCDHEGYYQKEQCMGSAPSVQTCWCVTPSGSEIPGSRISGRAHCGKLDNMGYPKNM